MQPDETLDRLRRNQRVYRIAGVVALAAAPAAWIGMTILGVADSFLTTSETANPTPEELATGVYVAMLGLPAAFVFSVLGLVLVFVSARRKRKLDELEREFRDELTT